MQQLTTQNLLRNTIIESATNADSTAQQSKTPPIVVALQRLLFVLVNLLLVHNVAQQVSRVFGFGLSGISLHEKRAGKMQLNDTKLESRNAFMFSYVTDG